MKTSTLVLLGLGALALSSSSRSVGAQSGSPDSKITPEQSIAMGALTLPLNSYLNDLANRAASQGNQNQYDALLNQQKAIAGIQFQNLENSGFLTVSPGFAALARSLGINV